MAWWGIRYWWRYVVILTGRHLLHELQTNNNWYSFTEEGPADAGGFGNMQEMFANLNSGAAGKPSFDNFGDDLEKEDSDDDEIPNLE